MAGDRGDEVSDDQLEVIIHDLLDLYGYDFRGYSKPSFKRRLAQLIGRDRFSNFASFRLRLKGDKGYLDRFIEQITVNVSEMFRDPAFILTLSEKVLCELAAPPVIRIWHAGCSTGEEVYSMAILLHEAGLLERSLLYATDISGLALEKFSKGGYSSL